MIDKGFRLLFPALGQSCNARRIIRFDGPFEFRLRNIRHAERGNLLSSGQAGVFSYTRSRICTGAV